MLIFPIYGYCPLEPQKFSNFEILPVYETEGELFSAGQSEVFKGSAILKTEAESFNTKLLAPLKSVLTLIEGSEVDFHKGYFPDDLSECKAQVASLVHETKRKKNSPFIPLDDVHGRTEMISKVISKYTNSSSDKLMEMLTRYSITKHCGDARFVDVKYYLLWSALEAYAREKFNDSSNGAARPVCALLNEIGLEFEEVDAANSYRCVGVYNGIRHGLYHCSDIFGFHKKKTYKLVDYIPALERLVLWVVAFEFGYTNKHAKLSFWVDRELLGPNYNFQALR